MVCLNSHRIYLAQGLQLSIDPIKLRLKNLPLAKCPKNRLLAGMGQEVDRSDSSRHVSDDSIKNTHSPPLICFKSGTGFLDHRSLETISVTQC